MRGASAAVGTDKSQQLTLGALVLNNADAIKGLLLLLVVMDHNEWLRQLAPGLFRPLTFHVLGFLLLAFAFPSKPLTMRFVRDRACRYLVPFWWVLTLTSALFVTLVARDGDLVSGLMRWVVAAVLGNAPFVKASSGFLMLWYLPCLFGLSLLIGLANFNFSAKARRLVWLLAVVVHMAIPLVGASRTMWLPFGLAIGLEIFLLGLVWQWLLGVALHRFWIVVDAALFFCSYGALVSLGINIELGTMEISGPDRPVLMALQDVAGLSGVLVVVWLGVQLTGLRWLRAVGQHSLLLYLLHPLVYQVFNKMHWLPRPALLDGPALLLTGMLGAAAATGIAYAVSVLITRSPLLSGWVVPRGWDDWPPTHALTRRGSAAQG